MFHHFQPFDDQRAAFYSNCDFGIPIVIESGLVLYVSTWIETNEITRRNLVNLEE